MTIVAREGARALVVADRGLAGFLAALPAAIALAASGRPVSMATNDASALLPLATRPIAHADPGDPSATPDEVYLLDPSLGTALRFWRRGVPRRLGFVGGVTGLLRRPLLTDAATPDAGLRALLASVAVQPAPPPWLHVDAELGRRVVERLGRAGIDRDRSQLVVVAVGAGRGGTPRPRNAWTTRLQELRREDPHRRFVLLADTAAVWPAVQIHEDTGRLHPVIGPDLDLPARAGLLAAADFVVAENPEMRALAEAVGSPWRGLDGRLDGGLDGGAPVSPSPHDPPAP